MGKTRNFCPHAHTNKKLFSSAYFGRKTRYIFKAADSAPLVCPGESNRYAGRERTRDMRPLWGSSTDGLGARVVDVTFINNNQSITTENNNNHSGA